MPPQADRLVEVRAANVEAIRGADIRELALVPPDADARDHPTAAQHIERRELLRQHDGVPLRDDDDARGELHAAVPRADPAERQDRVEDAPVIRRGRALDENVIRRPDRRPGESLRGLRGRLDAFAIRAVGEVRNADSVVHRGIVAGTRTYPGGARSAPNGNTGSRNGVDRPPGAVVRVAKSTTDPLARGSPAGPARVVRACGRFPLTVARTVSHRHRPLRPVSWQEGAH